jgi:hypothetical protein
MSTLREENTNEYDPINKVVGLKWEHAERKILLSILLSQQVRVQIWVLKLVYTNQMLLQGEFYSLVAYSFITELQGELSFMSVCKRDREMLLCSSVGTVFSLGFVMNFVWYHVSKSISL